MCMNVKIIFSNNYILYKIAKNWISKVKRIQILEQFCEMYCLHNHSLLHAYTEDENFLQSWEQRLLVTSWLSFPALVCQQLCRSILGDFALPSCLKVHHHHLVWQSHHLYSKSRPHALATKCHRPKRVSRNLP